MRNSEIGGHLGRYLEFIKRPRLDSWGLLVCCRGWLTERFLKFQLTMNLFQLSLIYTLMVLAYILLSSQSWQYRDRGKHGTWTMPYSYCE